MRTLKHLCKRCTLILAKSDQVLTVEILSCKVQGVDPKDDTLSMDLKWHLEFLTHTIYRWDIWNGKESRWESVRVKWERVVRPVLQLTKPFTYKTYNWKNKSKRMYFIFRKRPLLQNLLDILKQFLMLKKIVTLTNDNYLATLGSM